MSPAICLVNSGPDVHNADKFYGEREFLGRHFEGGFVCSGSIEARASINRREVSISSVSTFLRTADRPRYFYQIPRYAVSLSLSSLWPLIASPHAGEEPAIPFSLRLHFVHKRPVTISPCGSEAYISHELDADALELCILEHTEHSSPNRASARLCGSRNNL